MARFRPQVLLSRRLSLILAGLRIACVLLRWGSCVLWALLLVLEMRLQWVAARSIAGKRIVSSMCGLFFQPPLLAPVLVVFMREVAAGYYFQAAEDHDVTLSLRARTALRLCTCKKN